MVPKVRVPLDPAWAELPDSKSNLKLDPRATLGFHLHHLPEPVRISQALGRRICLCVSLDFLQ